MFWELAVPDSWGRLPIGLMMGHTISMGTYEECLELSRRFSAEDYIRGQYCLAKVPIKGFMSKINKDEPEVGRAISYKQKEPEFFELGICVPSSCSPQKSNEILKQVIQKFYGQDITETMVAEEFCDIDEPITLRGIDIFAM